MIALTKNEFRALEACLNYDNRIEQMDDNMSNGGQEEFKKLLKWNDKQVSALIGSLEKKGLGYSDDNDGNGHIFWLSEKAVNLVFDILEGLAAAPAE